MIKIGIVVADVDEYEPFANTIEKGKYEEYSFLGRKAHKFFVDNGKNKAEVISILCGIGKVNATAAAMHLVDIGCNVILNYGLSGGVSGILRNQISAPDKFLEHDFDLTVLGYEIGEKPIQKYIYKADEKLINIAKKVIPDLKIGTAVCGDHFICDDTVREVLTQKFCAMSCDMETGAIAYVCEFSNTPFLALRRISDDAGNDAHESYTEMNTSGETLLSDYIIEIIKEYI